MAAGDASTAQKSDLWMPAHVAFTAQDATFLYRTITVNFNDVALPGMLRAAIEVGTAAKALPSLPRCACHLLASADFAL